MEEWRAVVGYEGSYQVSSLGRVRSLDRVVLCAPGRWGRAYKRRCPSTILKQYQEVGGYPKVNLHLGERQISVNVHRLAAEAFFGECPEGKEASHLDGDRGNNAKSNLLWETRSENHRRKRAHGTSLQGSRSPTAKLNSQAVLVIRHAASRGVSGALLARLHGVSPSTIYLVLKRRKWGHVADA